MYFAAIHYGLVAFGLLLTSANASPYYGINVGYSKLQARDLFVDPSTCDDFVIGATNTKVGQVCVGISGGILNVAYGKLNSCTYSSVHVYVGTVPPTNRNPGGFPYSSDPGGICTLSADRTTASCPIPVQNSWKACEQTLYIATHGSVNCSPGGGQTGWGMGTCIGGSNGNCAKYWMFTTHCYCPSVSVFPQQYQTSTSIFTSTSTTAFLTSTTVTYTTSTTSEYSTSTTITYTTSTTSTYTTSTTVVYDTSTTSLYTTTQYPETVITSVTTSTLPLSSTTYTLTCTNPRP
ncbi:hypothetical protein EYR41_010128 [Orbilia oligospora]|uniref:CBM1 domain-containing protein n=1 Tax=Orbilia oligospora TaxID=2813651 RepID=A0A8H2DSC6_ORBOL|nr:hypothetical protein EYR41_010128 [Orbilia oligospora]